ncbi:MAG TPA: FAD-binding protein [Solirubrobacteraceae bacterium]|jgi:predicted oxidoreductase|nr:FAD-binding protein [Solirubrobacteraceae bacterium]
MPNSNGNASHAALDALAPGAIPDVIVVGAGLAGLVSTLELLRSGDTVLLLDRCRPEEVGGLAREAFGGMFMVDSPEQRRSRIRDSERLALEDWLRIAELGLEEQWPRRWAEQYVTRARDDVGGWLREIGVRFFPVVNWAERGNFGDGNSVPRFHLTWGTGKALVEAVWGAIQRHPRREALQVRLRTRVTELLIHDGRAVGCRAVWEGEDEDPHKGGRGEGLPTAQTLHAQKAVVIAAGGIGGNHELVRRVWPTSELGSPPRRMLMGSHYYADGALHEEVERLGGAVTHLERMWNYADAVRHPAPQRPGHGLKLIPPRSGLMLDPDGRRYGPVPVMPTYDAYAALERMCEDERKYSWLVCNRKIALRELDVSGSQHNPHLRERRVLPFVLGVLLGKPRQLEQLLRSPDFVTADTLSELARRMNEVTGRLDAETGETAAGAGPGAGTTPQPTGEPDAGPIDPDVLAAEIGRYDETIARGKGQFNDDQLRRIGQLRNWRGDRLRTCAFQRILDPKAGPLIAIRLQVMARKSLGGIQTDLACHVLRTDDGQPIHGLYAVGEAAGFGGGGMHGKRSLEGTFLGGCVFTGRLAAAAIAGAELPLRIPPRVGASSAAGPSGTPRAGSRAP